MKIYIKSFLGFVVLAFMISIFSSTALANDVIGLPSEKQIKVDFKITSGIDVDKEKESTFDKKRTLTGTAEERTTVTVNVYGTKDETTEKETSEKETSATNYKITVGVSGIFSQTIELNIGENIVEITVEKEGYDSVTKTYTINRKNRDIKQELEKTIVLPGDSSNTSNKTSNLK